MSIFSKSRRLIITLRQAILVALVFVLSTEPVLVAAKGLRSEAERQPIQLVSQDILSRSLWGDFVAFVRRAGADLLLNLGFDEGSALVGRVLNLGVDLSDEALVAVKKVSDDLIAAGIDLSDEAAGGLGKFAKSMDADEFQQFVNALGNTCSVGELDHSPKLAMLSKSAASDVCNPDLFKKIMRDFNGYDDIIYQGVGKVSKAVGPEDFAKLMAMVSSSPNSLEGASRIFGKLGNAASPDVIKTAMSKGPDAVDALSYWPKTFLETDLAKELAERSGRDAKALAAVTDGNLTEAAKNSIHGSGNYFVIGKWDEDLGITGGYVDYARTHGGQYYTSHPQVYEVLKNKYGEGSAQLSSKLWEINLNAISEPVSNGTPFRYSLNGVVNTAAERGAIEAMWAGKGWNEILSKLGITNGEIPGRMKELMELKNAGYLPEDLTSATILFNKH